MNRSTPRSLSRPLSLLTTLALSLACLIGVDASQNEAEANRSVTTTTTTTKKVTRRANRSSRRRAARKSVTRRSSARRAGQSRAVASRRYSRRGARRSYSSYGRSRRAVVRHHSTRRGVTSSSAGFTNRVLFEVGGSVFAPLQGEVSSGLHLALGSRIGPIGGVVEAQLAQDPAGARLSDLNAQLRIYLPLGDNAEVFPLIAIGESELLSSRSSSHLDLGIGAQLNVNQHLAVGARYSARLIAEEVNGVPANGHTLTGQVAVRF